MRMKKLFITFMAAAISAMMFTGCGATQEKNINVIARDSASGTREAFESLIVDTDGTKLAGKMTSAAEELEATSAVIAKVAANKTAIGYISLGSLDSSIKAVKVDGVAASVENVVSGSYTIWRPFVILVNKELSDAGNLTLATQDFLKYLKSTEASAIISEDGFVPTSGEASFVSNSASGTVIIRGSTSVEKIMTVLMDAYLKKNANVTFDLDCKGSGAGRTAAKEDTSGNVIGMSSSAIKTSEEEYFVQFDLAKDAVAVVVNKDNTIENLTIKNIFDIYAGTVTKFSEIK